MPRRSRTTAGCSRLSSARHLAGRHAPHFTLPLWVADVGGFENPEIASLMAHYARVVGESLAT